MKTQINHIPVLATSPDDLSRLLSASIELEETKKELKLLKSMVTLTEFSIDHIAVALVAFQEQKEQAIHQLAMHNVVGTNPEHEIYQFWQKQLDIAMDWLIQLENAKSIVLNRETVISN